MPEVRDEATESPTWENGRESRRPSLKTVASVKQVGYSSRPRGLPGLLTKDRKLTIRTGSQQLDGRILEKCCWGLMSHHVLWVNFCSNIWMVDSEFGVNNMKAWAYPGWITNLGWCQWNCVCLGVNFLVNSHFNCFYWSSPSGFCCVTKWQSSQSVFTLGLFQPSKWSHGCDSASFAHM